MMDGCNINCTNSSLKWLIHRHRNLRINIYRISNERVEIENKWIDSLLFYERSVLKDRFDLVNVTIYKFILVGVVTNAK